MRVPACLLNEPSCWHAGTRKGMPLLFAYYLRPKIALILEIDIRLVDVLGFSNPLRRIK